MLPLEQSEHYRTQAESIARQLENFAQKFEKTLEERTVGIDQVLEKADERDPARRRQLVEESRRALWYQATENKEYVELLRDSEALEKNVTEAADFYGDNQRLSELLTIDDPRRSQYAPLVRGANHAALKTLSVKATQERNFPLAVEISREVVSMFKVKDWPFDPRELITFCLPDHAKRHVADLRDATLALGKAKITRHRISLGARQFGEGSSLDKIRFGLANRAARVGPPSPKGLPPASKPPTSALDKITLGLAAGEAKR